MNDSQHRPECAGKQVHFIPLVVCNSEEDEAEERVEGRSEEGKEISHAWHDLGEDECDGPDTDHDRSPNAPADDRAAVCVVGLAHYPGIYEFCADIGVDDADDNGGDNDKPEGALLVGGDAQTAESWGSGVLAQVVEPN